MWLFFHSLSYHEIGKLVEPRCRGSLCRHYSCFHGSSSTSVHSAAPLVAEVTCKQLHSWPTAQSQFKTFKVCLTFKQNTHTHTQKKHVWYKSNYATCKKKNVEWKHAFKSVNLYFPCSDFTFMTNKLQILQAHTLKEKYIVIILKLQWKHYDAMWKTLKCEFYYLHKKK